MSCFRYRWIMTLIIASNFCFACQSLDEGQSSESAEKESGWIGADSYEVGALVSGSVQHALNGDWSDLETNAERQQQLIDLQIKFIKTKAENEGWRLNQLSEAVRVTDFIKGDGVVTLNYEADIDMLGRLRGNVPRLTDLDNPIFAAKVPTTPDAFSYDEMKACSQVDDDHSVRDYNFHYYFSPDQAGCDIALTPIRIEITEVFPRFKTYPEYDLLMQKQDDGTVGFSAALVPNLGDNDPKSRLEAHANMLERDLGLVGVPMEDGAYTRYTMGKGNVRMTIDLYDPTVLNWRSQFDGYFREKLKDYTLVHYNGHSSYGSKHLLDDPDAFSDEYQIIMLHSCQSFAYYSRQVFRAKASSADPQGFALADVVATGKSSYPSGAPKTLRVLLESLFDSMVAIDAGRPGDAVDWISIAEGMKGSTWGDILYGVAGVRSNTWRP